VVGMDFKTVLATKISIFSTLRMRLCLCVLAIFCLSATSSAQSVVYTPVLTSIAGVGSSSNNNGNNAAATAAGMKGTYAGAFDKFGNLFIADYGGNDVRVVYGPASTNGVANPLVINGYPTPTPGYIYQYAGTGTSGNTCVTTTTGTQAVTCLIYRPFGIAVDSNENVYVSDPNWNIIRKIDASGNMYIFAGQDAASQGAVGTASGDNGSATAAGLYYPTDLQIDPTGQYLYFVDEKNSAIRRINLTNNTITRVAGVEGTSCATLSSTTVKSASCGDGGSALLANLSSSVSGIAFDSAGDLFIADSRLSRVRKVLAGSTPTITTVAGSGLEGTDVATYAGATNGDGGPALSANLIAPQRVAIDSVGNIYISDNTDNEIRVVNTATGNISAYLGNGTIASAYPGSPAAAEQINDPIGLFWDNSGNLYFAEYNYAVIRKVSTGLQFPTTAVASTSAAQSIYEFFNAADTLSTATTASGFTDFTIGTMAGTGCKLAQSIPAYSTCSLPTKFAPKLPGLRTAPLVITDSSNALSVAGLSGTGNAPAAAIYPSIITSTLNTGLLSPTSGVLDSAGNFYFADTGNNEVKKIAAGATTATVVAGNGTAGYLGDSGLATSAELKAPAAITLDAAGDIYIADTGNSVVRFVSATTGNISTFAGTGTAGYAGDGAAAISAQLTKPAGLAVDASGDLYIADTGNNRLREVVSGTINTVAGNGTAGYTDASGVALSAEFTGPEGLALGPDGSINIADTGNNVIRKYTPSAGTIASIAGTGGTSGYKGDNGAATGAELSAPSAVALDAAGNLYIADTGNNAVRFVNEASGLIGTIAGTGTPGYTGDSGTSTSAELFSPAGIAVNLAGELLIADSGNNAIRSINNQQPTLTFPPQAAGTTSSAQTVALINTGNQTLTLTGLAITTGFTQKPSGATDCTATSTIAAGAGCNISIVAQPTLGGSNPGTVTITDNALNSSSSTQIIQLASTGIVAPTSLAVSVSPSAIVNGTDTAGTALSVTATPMAAGSAIPTFTGTVKITSTDPNAVISPTSHTYTSTDAGSYTFTVTLKTAGSQSFTATDAGDSLTGTINTTVVAAAAATISATAGTNQTIQINHAFPTALQVKVVDAYLNPVSGVSVTFTAPSTGASAAFSGTGATASVSTNNAGVATAPALTANGTAGTYTVNASVAGVTTPAAFPLTNSSLAVPTITLVSNPTSGIVYGSSIALTSTVTSTGSPQPTGTVTFYDTPSGGSKTQIGNPVTLSSQSASVTETLPAGGSHSFSTIYSGDTNYASNQSTLSLTVSPTTSSITGPATQPVPVQAGQTASIPVTAVGISATGAAVPTGSLSYTINSGTAQSAVLSNGQATLTVPNTLVAGSYSIAISYPGDSNYLASTGTVTFTVTQQSQTITFGALANQAYGAAPITLSATSSSGLSVSFGVTGPATLSGTTLTLTGAGKVTVTATQAGNLIYSAATPILQSFTIAQAATATTLASSSNPVATGSTVTFTATVTPPTGLPANSMTGTVSFLNGTTVLGTSALNGGVATYATSALPLGTTTITATYSGDTNFLTSTSSGLTETIAPQSFTVTANPQSLTITNGQSGTITLTVTSVLGYSSTQLAVTCNPLPRSSYCYTPSGALLSVKSNGSVTATITLQTTPTAGLFSKNPDRSGTSFRLALIPAVLLLIPLAMGMNNRRRWSAMLLLLVAAFAFSTLSGCGTSSSILPLTQGTPTGVTNMVIYVTDGTTTESTPVVVTVQ